MSEREARETEIDMRIGTTFRPFEPSAGREGSAGSFARGSRASARTGGWGSGCMGRAPWATTWDMSGESGCMGLAP